MTVVTRPAPRRVSGHRLWIPRQHGAWAMLLLPVLLGVAASAPNPWQLAVAVAALAAYLASATAQTWSRSRRPPEYRLPIAVYGSVAAVVGLALVVRFPELLLAAVVVVPTGIAVLRGAQPGTRRDLANSFAQVAQSLVLVPVTAWVSGTWDPALVLAYTLVAAGYQVGVVLVVRSVLRERGNEAFAAVSVGFHVALVVLAVLLLPLPYAILAGGLALRSAALPIAQRRLAGGPRPLRPIHVGIVEIVASLAVVVTSLAVPI
jgi:asparagine N-glycosylation enzyme membrane subunit Stt3